jgi:hypothetical protein
MWSHTGDPGEKNGVACAPLRSLEVSGSKHRHSVIAARLANGNGHIRAALLARRSCQTVQMLVQSVFPDAGGVLGTADSQAGSFLALPLADTVRIVHDGGPGDQ